MKKRGWVIGLCAAVAAGVALSLFRYTKSEDEIAVKGADLMEGIQKNRVDTQVNMTKDGAVVLSDFGVRLLQNLGKEKQNCLISPFSVIYALGMTANGAQERTLEQMEQVFGIKREELNAYLHAYAEALPKGKKYKLSIANSIWFKEDENFKVNRDFLQTNADWYGSEIYKQPFSPDTADQINHWVDEHTDGMIPEIVSEVPEDAIMYLVNALAFDAEWETIYKESQIQEDTFTTEDGRKQQTEMMYSTEKQYLEDENTTGFLKYYSGKKYAFAALLPKEGVRMEDYIASLTGEKLQKILQNPVSISVNAAIPKFECKYETELAEVFRGLGMTDAFDAEMADFTGIGSYKNQNIFINKILHKTFIAVDEKGTRAGAATAVEMVRGLALIEEKVVYLDRPFVYLLIDCEENVPLFIGTLMEVENKN